MVISDARRLHFHLLHSLHLFLNHYKWPAGVLSLLDGGIGSTGLSWLRACHFTLLWWW